MKTTKHPSIKAQLYQQLLGKHHARVGLKPLHSNTFYLNGYSKQYAFEQSKTF